MILATGLALGAAVLHAAWNLAAKSSGDRFAFVWAMSVYGGLVAAPAMLVLGWPGSQAIPYFVASAVVHAFYMWLLSRAYDLGDFSVAYPVARGGGAFLAAIGGVVLLDDRFSFPAAVGAAVVLAGLVSLARLRSSGGGLMAALATAVAIGGYTLIDSAGSRAANGPGYGAAIMMSTALSVSVFGLATGHAASLPRHLGSWRVAVAGVARAAAYIAVLVAVRHAPVGFVACLRESSVVLGALGGWLLLREPMARGRIVSSGVVAGGVALLVLVR